MFELFIYVILNVSIGIYDFFYFFEVKIDFYEVILECINKWFYWF